MTLLERFYPESKFGGFADVDGTICFYTRVNSLIKKDSILLDVGCGRGEYDDDLVEYRKNLRIFKGKCSRVIGIDVDEGASQNPYLDEFQLINDGKWNVSDHSVDIIICDYVLEHIANPDKLFTEFYRVLKPNGILCARTPNLYSYFGFASNMIPDKYHTSLVTKLQEARKPEDVFPKYYRANSLSKLRKLIKAHNFEGIVYGFEGEPAYFAFSGLLYFIGTLFPAITPKYFRTQLHLFAKRKPA